MAGNGVLSSFAHAGAVCNDTARQLEGGLWQNVIEEVQGSAGALVADLQSVRATLHR